MKVHELIDRLQKYNPEAVVYRPGQGFETEAGTWLEGDEEEIYWVSPDQEEYFETTQRVTLS